jgi:ankyrin repeat protein
MSTQDLLNACKRGDCVAIDLLLKIMDVNIQDDKGRTGLHLASEYGHTKAIRLLLKRGANRMIYDNTKNTPLMKAYRARHVHVYHILTQ